MLYVITDRCPWFLYAGSTSLKRITGQCEANYKIPDTIRTGNCSITSAAHRHTSGKGYLGNDVGENVCLGRADWELPVRKRLIIVMYCCELRGRSRFVGLGSSTLALYILFCFSKAISLV